MNTKESLEIKDMNLGINVSLKYHPMTPVVTTRKNGSTITGTERNKLRNLRYKKKNNPSKFTKENQEELSRLVLKMNTK